MSLRHFQNCNMLIINHFRNYGVEDKFDGLKEKGPLNINRATQDQLETLPGIDAAAAHRIIAARPFSDSRDLLKRRLVSKAEFDRIAGKIEAK